MPPSRRIPHGFLARLEVPFFEEGMEQHVPKPPGPEEL